MCDDCVRNVPYCADCVRNVPYFPAHKTLRDFFVRNFRKKKKMNVF